MKECRECGHPLTDNARFCPVCGTAVLDGQNQHVAAPVNRFGQIPVNVPVQKPVNTPAQEPLNGPEPVNVAEPANEPQPVAEPENVATIEPDSLLEDSEPNANVQPQEPAEPVEADVADDIQDEDVDDDDDSSVPYDIYLDEKKNYKPYYIGAAVVAVLALGWLLWTNIVKAGGEGDAIAKTSMANGFYCYEGKWNAGTDSVACRVEFEKVGDTLLNCVYTDLGKKESLPMTFRSANGMYVFKDKESDGRKLVLQMKQPITADSKLEGVGLFLPYDSNERLLALNNLKRTKEELEGEAKADQTATQQAAAQQQAAAAQQAAARQQQAVRQQQAAAQQAARQQQARQQSSSRQQARQQTAQPAARPAAPAVSSNHDIKDSRSNGQRHITNPSGHGDTTKDKPKKSSGNSNQDVKD